MRRLASLAAVLLLAFAAQPGAAQIGINGTRQAASTGGVEIRFSPVSRCGRNRVAIALAGSEARAIQREQLAMDYRRLRYAGGGLTEAEAAALDRRARRIELEVGRAYRAPPYGFNSRRYGRADGRRAHRGC
jgi:hypothetical protein